jgi:hypothetical protein
LPAAKGLQSFAFQVVSRDDKDTVSPQIRQLDYFQVTPRQRLAKPDAGVPGALEIVAPSNQDLADFLLGHSMAVNVRLIGFRIYVEPDVHYCVPCACISVPSFCSGFLATPLLLVPVRFAKERVVIGNPFDNAYDRVRALAACGTRFDCRLTAWVTAAGPMAPFADRPAYGTPNYRYRRLTTARWSIQVTVSAVW